jgi:hypothetical protein
MKKMYKAFIATIAQVILTWFGYFLDKTVAFVDQTPSSTLASGATGAGIAYAVTWFAFLIFFLCWILAGFWKE